MNENLLAAAQFVIASTALQARLSENALAVAQVEALVSS
jgi:hypothetical protein